MKVGLIGDIHANLPALETVYSHIEDEVDCILNVGDFVGYGAFPEKVVSFVRRNNIVSIKGNYDCKVLKFRQKDKKWRKTKRYEKWLAFKWAYENLSGKSRRYLSELPKEIQMEVEGKKILLTHGSPTTSGEHLTLNTPIKRYRRIALTAQADFVIFGHSHIPFALQVDEVWFINPGSVGRQDDGDPRASYAILNLGLSRPEVHHYRIEYAVDEAIAAIREKNLPEAFAKMMIYGRKLDDILEAR